MNPERHGILEHLKDLRTCVFRAMLGIFVGMIACFAFADKLLFRLRAPMQERLGASAKFIV